MGGAPSAPAPPSRRWFNAAGRAAEPEPGQPQEPYRPLRVTDVVEGVDWVGIRDITHVDPAIRPIWRPVRAVGIALTVRWIPTTRSVPTMTPEEYTEFTSHWYREIGKYPFGRLVQQGTFLMVDAAGTDVGMLGSNNVLEYVNRGATGICTDGGCRDTDEIILQKNPVWCRHISRTMVQGVSSSTPWKSRWWWAACWCERGTWGLRTWTGWWWCPLRPPRTWAGTRTRS